MLTATDVLQTIVHNEWFTYVDMEDAYFHVPIARQHRQLLRFAYSGRYWVLPFGVSLSLTVFSQVVAAALQPLQSQGMKVFPY